MNIIGFAALCLFVLAWLAGVVTWFMAAYFMVRFWLRLDEPTDGANLGRALKYMGLFVAFVLAALAAGLLGDLVGHWSALVRSAHSAR